MMARTRYRELAWAIWLGLTDFDRDMLRRGQSKFTGHHYMGVLFFATTPPAWHDGCRIALFSTRREARAALGEYKQEAFGWPRARVERVTVKVVRHPS
jgi:hypothetical protein